MEAARRQTLSGARGMTPPGIEEALLSTREPEATCGTKTVDGFCYHDAQFHDPVRGQVEAAYLIAQMGAVPVASGYKSLRISWLAFDPGSTMGSAS